MTKPRGVRRNTGIIEDAMNNKERKMVTTYLTKEKLERVLSVVDCSNCGFTVDEHDDILVCHECSDKLDNWEMGENIPYEEAKKIYAVANAIGESDSEFKYIIRAGL